MKVAGIIFKEVQNNISSKFDCDLFFQANLSNAKRDLHTLAVEKQQLLNQITSLTTRHKAELEELQREKTQLIQSLQVVL